MSTYEPPLDESGNIDWYCVVDDLCEKKRQGYENLPAAILKAIDANARKEEREACIKDLHTAGLTKQPMFWRGDVEAKIRNREELK